MSERMTVEQCFERANAAADAADPLERDMGVRGFARAQFWREEAMRARSSEDQKDAVIKALADVLEWLRAEVDMGLVTKDTAKAVDAALRLAGRLS